MLLFDFDLVGVSPQNNEHRNFVHSSSAPLSCICIRSSNSIIHCEMFSLSISSLFYAINFSHCVNITTIKLDRDTFNAVVYVAKTIRLLHCAVYEFLLCLGAFGLILFDQFQIFCGRSCISSRRTELYEIFRIASNIVVKNGWTNNRNY